ncbi:MAG: dihydropteroate synthase [Gammaproteobacteria bacterium]|nr:dihydropteroate synthase [Gammaproteobacteria bacterium]MBU1654691.1 dihydropteroate synthase [Gammaproteobacteria bacterium]MBU1961415.1 dihydropteroate synthase [Gammaproteobacteria bacterium]
MGILNVTPDSFSDGGRFQGLEQALRQGSRMAGEGAAILDIGGESTRPGASPVSLQEELDRVIPVIERLHAELPLPLSIDTSKPEVMAEAVRAGAGLINDIFALRKGDALAVAAASGVPVCLMHMQGEPDSMQTAPAYDDVVADVMTFLRERIAACAGAGIPPERVLIDPGFGFGKGLAHNLSLLARLAEFRALGHGLLVGISRKSMVGAVLGGVPVEQRINGSLAAAVMAVERGARLLRVHDVKETVEAAKMAWAVIERTEEPL